MTHSGTPALGSDWGAALLAPEPLAPPHPVACTSSHSRRPARGVMRRLSKPSIKIRDTAIDITTPENETVRVRRGRPLTARNTRHRWRTRRQCHRPGPVCYGMRSRERLAESGRGKWAIAGRWGVRAIIGGCASWLSWLVIIQSGKREAYAPEDAHLWLNFQYPTNSVILTIAFIVGPPNACGLERSWAGSPSLRSLRSRSAP